MNSSGKNLIIPNININDYNYELPKEKIALYPSENRSNSKLLVINRVTGELQNTVFSEIDKYVPEKSLLLINDTKVIAARIAMKKPTGGIVEVFLVEPLLPSHDPQIAMQERKTTTWKAIIGGRAVKPGMSLTPLTSNENINFKAKILSRNSNEADVEFCWDSACSFSEIVGLYGVVPLPPYIKRKPVDVDKERYQTVYANAEGSAAAPTAGLHFTDEILNKLAINGIENVRLTLHVGPGTFQPVDAQNISDHTMHREQFSITLKALERIIQFLENKPDRAKLTAVGTTSVRTLESVYWLGALMLSGANPFYEDSFATLSQWQCYELENNGVIPKPADSLKAVRDELVNRNLEELHGSTQLIIVPGYSYKLVQAIITNYHMPKSTLLLLVTAFLGKELWREAYSFALANDYRFLSYGDSSLLL